MGDWKLVEAGGEPARLVNLATDIGETKDLSTQHPDQRAKLEAAWKAWDAELVPPAWKVRRAAGKTKKTKKAAG